MSLAARERAEQFTWARFRGQIASSVEVFLAGSPVAREMVASHV